MHKNTDSLVAFRLLLLVACLFACSALQAKSFYWEVKSEQTTVYLLGSIHVASEDFYPLPDIIEQGFKRAQALAVEIDAAAIDQTQMQQILLSQAIYPGNEMLSDHVSKATYTNLTDYLEKNQLPIQAFAKMKPGIVAMMLSMAKMAELGYTPEYGIDMYFLKKAKGVKQIIELERYQDQMDLLLSLPNTDTYLQYTIDQLDDINAQLGTVIGAWKSGDTRKLEQLVIIDAEKDFPEMREINKRMFATRNQNMADKIASFLTTSKIYFVVVGAGHLVGQQGIVALLQKRGFRVQQH